MWFCVHAIFYLQLQEKTHDSWLVHENVYLANAVDSIAACELIQTKALLAEDLSKDGHLLLNDEKASYRFAGIRKVMSV
jgi:hypothetical protein